MAWTFRIFYNCDPVEVIASIARMTGQYNLVSFPKALGACMGLLPQTGCIRYYDVVANE